MIAIPGMTGRDAALREGSSAALSVARDAASDLVLVRGLSEIASAVAHRLFTSGYGVALHNGPDAPKTHRRLMSFADAFFDGSAVLDGVTARRVESLTLDGTREFIPVLVNELAACLGIRKWDVIVDARLRKRVMPECHRGLAALSIGIGPGHVAGETADVAVESSWGDSLGAVVRSGPTLPLAGEPQPIDGVGRERNVYASVPGVLQSQRCIGDVVTAGAVVAFVGGWPIHAPISGTMRGLVRPGIEVSPGDKIVEIDPRPPCRASYRGLGERPSRVANGVLSATGEWRKAQSA
jgi:xanthine dehydrogenase accessory factor